MEWNNVLGHKLYNNISYGLSQGYGPSKKCSQSCMNKLLENEVQCSNKYEKHVPLICVHCQ